MKYLEFIFVLLIVAGVQLLYSLHQDDLKRGSRMTASQCFNRCSGVKPRARRATLTSDGDCVCEVGK